LREVYALCEDERRGQPQSPRLLAAADENRDDLVDRAPKDGIPFRDEGPVRKAVCHLIESGPGPPDQRRIARERARNEPMHDQLRGVIYGLSVERRAHRWSAPSADIIPRAGKFSIIERVQLFRLRRPAN
jgi:hypothetical protein